MVICQLLVPLALLSSDCQHCLQPYRQIDAGNRDTTTSITEDPDGAVAVLTTSSDIGFDCPERVFLHTVDQGFNWSIPVFIDSDPVYVTCPDRQQSQLVSDGVARSYVPFVARTSATGTPTLVVKVSADRGVTWPPQVSVVTPLGSSPTTREYLLLADPDGRVWIVYKDGPTDVEVDLHVARSNDGGMSWAAPVRISSAPAAPALDFDAVRDGTDGVVVAWLADAGGGVERLWSARSDDAGATWGPARTIDALTAAVNQSGVRLLSLAPGHVLVVWGDDRAGQRDPLSRVSLDGGRSFTLPIVRIDEGDSPGASASGLPDLERVGEALGLVATWVDLRDGRPQVYVNRSPDGGLTWGEPAGSPAVRVSTYTPDSVPAGPGIAGHREGWVTVGWRDAGRDAMARCGTNNCPAAYITTSCDGGRTWEPDLRVIDERSGVNGVEPVRFLDAADGLVFLTARTAVHFARLDGPTVVHPAGPTTYCVGNDPRLDSGALSATCTGGLSLQWYLAGVQVPGATGPSWQPSLPAGDHQVEVRGTCPSVPSCAPGWIGRELHVRAPAQPPDVGNALRAARAGGGVQLDWTRAAPAGDVHAHVRRADAKALPWAFIAPDPLAAETFLDPAPNPLPLQLYDVRRADVCEVESAN